MTEFTILITFCVALFASLLSGVPLLYALLFGLFLFAGFGVYRAGIRETAKMCWNGVKTTRSILLLFVLLGFLTSLWRASGTIPTVVYHAVNLISPASFILITFLLNSAMSLLTGTALGTAGTMGVICAMMGRALGVDETWMGGAILAGVYFGNRISPISSMALLAANVTKTNIYQNIREMLKTTWLPFLLSCLIYFIAGLGNVSSSEIAAETSVAQNIAEIFSREFSLSYWSLAPAFVIIILSIVRVRTSLVLLWSSIAAFIVAVTIENHSVMDLLEFIAFGYKTSIPEIAKMVNGGGLLSMVNVFFIVVIAGCFGGIFKGTNMLQSLQSLIAKLSKKTNPFVATLASACLISCVVCNQTLTIILTNQMTENLNSSNRNLHALNIYDTAVTVIALVPWSVATVMVLNAAQAPNKAVFCACFLYLLPLCRMVKNPKFSS